MFGPLGFWEILFIVVLALLIFGPKKLPEVGRTVGRGMAEFKKATTDLKKTIENEVNLEELKPTLEGPRPVESAADRTVERSSHRSGSSSEPDSGSSDGVDTTPTESVPSEAAGSVPSEAAGTVTGPASVD